MENQPPSSSASSWLNRPPTVVDERDTELTKLKERLGFYESFDQIIQDNVARAGELLRHAASMRESAEESLATAKQELEQSREAERKDFRALLSGLLDDVTTMQVQIERLARKVADALDSVESTLPINGELDRLPTDLPDPTPAIAAGAAAEWQPSALDPTPDEIGPAETTDTEAAAMGTVQAVADEPYEIEAEIAAAEATEQAEVAEFAAQAAKDSVESEETESTEAVGDELGEDAPEPQIAAETGEIEPEAVAAEAETDPAAETEHEIDSSTDTALPPVDEFDRLVAEAIPGDEGAATEESEPVGTATVAGLLAREAVDEEISEAPAAEEPDELVVEAEQADDTTEAIESEAEPETARVDLKDEAPAEPAPIAASAATDSAPPQDTATAAQPDIRPFPAGGLGAANPRPATGELRSPEPARFSPPTMVALGARGVGTVVLVHGVPRATTALSLKRFLESLPHVASVEPREYAEGVLRLHVTAQRAVEIDDLRGWSDGAGFEPVHLRDDLVEVRLPH
jgi:hypothetical protein